MSIELRNRSLRCLFTYLYYNRHHDVMVRHTLLLSREREWGKMDQLTDSRSIIDPRKTIIIFFFWDTNLICYTNAALLSKKKIQSDEKCTSLKDSLNSEKITTYRYFFFTHFRMKFDWSKMIWDKIDRLIYFNFFYDTGFWPWLHYTFAKVR